MKSTIRQEIRNRLAQLDEMARYTRSLSACKKLTSLPEFQQASTVMLYLSLPDEVQTAAAALAAWQRGKTVAVPKVYWEHRRIMPMEIQSLETGLVTTQHGIPEPAEERPIPLEMIDLIVVPGLAFDAQGNRLGRGGGFYDRFLCQPGNQAVTCGLAFHEQIVDELPVEAHDRVIDLLVTDEKVIRFDHREA